MVIKRTFSLIQLSMPVSFLTILLSCTTNAQTFHNPKINPVYFSVHIVQQLQQQITSLLKLICD